MTITGLQRFLSSEKKDPSVKQRKHLLYLRLGRHLQKCIKHFKWNFQHMVFSQYLEKHLFLPHFLLIIHTNCSNNLLPTQIGSPGRHWDCRPLIIFVPVSPLQRTSRTLRTCSPRKFPSGTPTTSWTRSRRRTQKKLQVRSRPSALHHDRSRVALFILKVEITCHSNSSSMSTNRNRDKK